MKKGRKLVSIILGVALTLQPFGDIEPAKAADEVVVADTFPDAKFRNYVTENFDTDKDGILSTEEIAAVTKIDVSKVNVITDMTGVQVFTELQTLNCAGQALKALDVTKLEKLQVIDASKNQLQSFILPKSAPDLWEVDIDTNQITELTSLSEYGNLQILDVGSNNLTTLELNQLSKLTNLDVSGNALTTLDLSANSKLEEVSCYNMTALPELDLATTATVDHTSLKKVSGGFYSEHGRGSLTKVDVSGDTGLTELDLTGNSVSSLNIKGATELQELYVADNKLTTLDVTEQTKLVRLYAYENKIETLDVTNNKSLISLHLSSLALEEIDVTQNTLLMYLNLADNKLSQIDVSKNTDLTQLDLSSNQLQKVDVSNNTSLTELRLDKNHLVAVDISNCKGLADGTFSCAGNTRDIVLSEPNFDFDLSTLAADGFVKEIDAGIDRGKDHEGDACIQVWKTQGEELVSTVSGASVTAWHMYPSVDSQQVKYNYYHGLGNGIVQFTLNISNPLTLKVWAKRADGEAITDENGEICVRVGERYILTATDENKNPHSNITWSSSDEDAAQIDVQTGELVFEKAGKVGIYVHINQKPRAVVEFSGHFPVASMKFVDSKSTEKTEYGDGDIVEMEAGTYAESTAKTKWLTVKGYDANGDMVDKAFSGVTYTVTDSKGADGNVTRNVITCSANGQVSAVGAGIAYLHCVSDDSGVETVIQFNVTRRVDSVSLTPAKVSMYTGDTRQLNAAISPATATNQKLLWTSNNEDVATVDEDGIVTAKAPGTVEITCTAADNDALHATSYITVTAAAEGVELNYTQYELVLGTTADARTVTLEATIESDGTTQYNPTWKSSNTAVATVRAGVVTAKAAGEALITCSVSDTKYAVCKITVTQKVTRIVVMDEENKALGKTLSMNINQTKQIHARVTPDTATNKEVVWSSSNPAVASISEDGMIQTLAKGQTVITCKSADGNVSLDAVTLTVRQPAEGLTIDKDIVALYTGKRETIKATILPENADNQSLLWQSDDPNIATVSNGIIFGVSAGATTIRCTTKDGTNLTKEIRVTVLQQIKKIQLNETKAQLLAGNILSLVAMIEPAAVTNAGLVWSTSNEAVATVDQNGVVTAVGRGTARITCAALDGLGAKAACDVTVTQLVSKITLSSNTMTVGVGKTSRLTAMVEPATASNRNVEWTSSNENVATVTSSGYVKGVAKGSAVITCKAKDASGIITACTVTVIEPITGVKLNVANKTLLVGKKVTLKATITPGTVDRKYVTWKTSNAKVATVTAGGVVKAVGRGTATISCEAQDGSGIRANCQITVKQPVKKVKLNKKTLKLKLKKSYKLKATVTPKNADNKAVKWKTSNKKVVTVTQSGKITAKKKGTATITITAKDGSKKKATCKVRVY